MAEPIHILATGGAGQVGLELARVEWPANVILHTPARDELDLSDIASVRSQFNDTPFAAVVNAGAYTAVDKAETDVTAAFAANATGPAVLAEATRAAGIPLIQVSTDYVFDGSKRTPYVEDDPVGPLGVYGASKLAGELAVRTGNPRSIVLRTAWVVSEHRANFLKTMLRLGLDRPTLRIVGDQRGCPTSAKDIARTLQAITLRMVDDPSCPTGIYHFVNAGETTWADFAREIFRRSAETGGSAVEVESITTADYPTPARRPANSALSCDRLSRDFGIRRQPWQAAIGEIVTALNSERSTA